MIQYTNNQYMCTEYTYTHSMYRLTEVVESHRPLRPFFFFSVLLRLFPVHLFFSFFSAFCPSFPFSFSSSYLILLSLFFFLYPFILYHLISSHHLSHSSIQSPQTLFLSIAALLHHPHWVPKSGRIYPNTPTQTNPNQPKLQLQSILNHSSKPAVTHEHPTTLSAPPDLFSSLVRLTSH